MPVPRRHPADSPRPARIAGAFAFAVLLIGAAAPTAGARERIVPSTGSYVATGRGDPSHYSVSAQVKRKGGRAVVSAQLRDSCGGFATFARVAVGRSPRGVPEFSARVGGAVIRGHWASATTIKGSVKTPCAAREAFAMHAGR
jgi:hypothetical protein